MGGREAQGGAGPLGDSIFCEEENNAIHQPFGDGLDHLYPPLYGEIGDGLLWFININYWEYDGKNWGSSQVMMLT